MICQQCGAVMLPIRHIELFQGPSRVVYECQRDPRHVKVKEIERSAMPPTGR